MFYISISKNRIMKKILLLLLIVAGAFQLKAQQQFNVKPSDSLLFHSPQHFYGLRLHDSTQFKKFLVVPKSDNLLALKSVSQPGRTEIFYSRMPVAKVSPVEKMPVAHGANIDNMPVLKVKVVDPLAVMKPVTP
jgi:hypothetical protein